MYEQSYSFHFEAAHELGDLVDKDPEHPYTHIHGHSFAVTVTVAAESVDQTGGWVMDFADLKRACHDVREGLDHRYLNKIEGLDRPTLENIARYIADALTPALPQIHAVEVARPSLGEKVLFRPKG